MQHVHYDLDKMEADIRKMYAEVEASHIPAETMEDRITNHWQNKFVDVVCAFMRWQMEMEMAGVSNKHHAYICGVGLGDLAQNVFGQYDPITAGFVAQTISQAYVNHVNQGMHRIMSGGEPDGKVEFDPVVSGRA